MRRGTEEPSRGVTGPRAWSPPRAWHPGPWRSETPCPPAGRSGGELGQDGLQRLLDLAGFRVERLTNPFGPELILGPLALPLTVLWVLAITNAVNLIDGLDGLAAGIGLIAALALAAVGLARGEVLLLVLSATMLGLTQRRAVLFMWATGAYFGLLAFVFSILPKEQALWAFLLLAVGVYTALGVWRRLERRAAHRQASTIAEELGRTRCG